MKKKTIVNGITWRKIYDSNGFIGRYLWKARVKNFAFVLTPSGSKYYCLAENKKLDIVWNSMWDKIEWANLDEAIAYCSNWKQDGHTCLGEGVKKTT